MTRAGDERKEGEAKPLPRGRRPKADIAEPAVWFSGAWRTPEGVENVRIRWRERQRLRRQQGSPK